MTEASFWRSTPRKLSALIAAYNRINDPDQSTRKPRNATLQDLSAWGLSLPPKG